MSETSKLDLRRELGDLYNAKRNPHIVDVPRANFLTVNGQGAPASQEFQRAIEALYSVAYKAKFSVKKKSGLDYAVMPLEGLWWSDDMADFMSGDRDRWHWTLMILQPPVVSESVIAQALAEAKGKSGTAELDALRFEPFAEGACAQVLHIGPFAEEHANILRMHALIEQMGGVFDGLAQKHHEIYLSDFRKTAPEKLKTILRQPFSRPAA